LLHIIDWSERQLSKQMKCVPFSMSHFLGLNYCHFVLCKTNLSQWTYVE